MASIKQIAAIALTLIIAVPIVLGYGFATTEETVTSWEVESTSNITDRLLNYDTYYTAEFMNPYNNKELITTDGSSWSIAAPNYQTLSSTYTSLPNYTTSSTTVSTNVSSTTYTPTEWTMIGSDGVSDADVTITSPMVYFHDYGTTTTAVVEGYLSEWENGDYGESIWFSAASPIEAYMSVNGSDSWLIQSGSTQYTWEDWVLEVGSESTSVLTTSEYVLVDPGTNDITFTTSDFAALKIVTSSSTYYETITGATTVILTAAGAATVGTTTYTDVTGFYIAEQPSVTSITYTYTAVNSNAYADPADGWTLTGAQGEWWFNGQQNEEVRLMVHLDSGETCVIGPSTDNTLQGPIQLDYDGTTLTVTNWVDHSSSSLGDYQNVMVVLTLTEGTIYGITDWPTLGVYPSTFNSVTVDYVDLDEPFRYIYLSGSASFRVDLTEIVAGTFPSTKDYWCYFGALYPEKNVAMTIKSVASYGDWLTFGVSGQDFGPSDGKITITDLDDGESYTVSIRGLTVKMIYDSDTATYTTYVNDHKINTSGNGGVYFGGEWSLTASASLLTQTTSTQQTWAAGEFAFEKEDFAACGLLVAGACLIGLGMTGSRSGAKMGVLLMICGGAGLIYLTLI